MQADTKQNIDPAEIEKFEQLADQWWNENGDFKPLHQLNPLRLEYIDGHANIVGKKVLDVGCGGGILAESMALKGALVTGIDMAEAPLEVAKLHLLESNAEVDYRRITVEDLAAECPASFDVITCMEMLEHVPDPASVIAACRKLVKEDGQIFFSTLNRTPKSYLFAIVGAEYLLQMLPKGTHDYAKFIRPSELEQWCRHGDIKMVELKGISYNPFIQNFFVSSDVAVNYIAFCLPR